MLVSTNTWDRLFEKLEELQDIVDVLEAELALASGKDELVDITKEDLAELKVMATGNAVPT